VVVLLGPEYPKRVWTRFESDQFKSRFGDGAVIPVWFSTAEPGMFDETSRLGGFKIDPNGDVNGQLIDLVDLLSRKLVDLRGMTDRLI